MQGMRKYVMLSCKELACGLREAERAGIRVVWCGQGKRGTGVAVLDAEDAAAVREKFGNCGCTADGWFSTDALLDLPPAAGQEVR
jgi:hypothetical protein